VAIIKSLDVFCDRCSAWTEGDTGRAATARRARADAKTRGWVYRKGEDICPDCQKAQT
jgi:hypothetical protein